MYKFILALVLVSSTISAQKRVLLMNGVAHLGNGVVLENSLIAFSNFSIGFETFVVANAIRYSIHDQYHEVR